jgi:hypothetical protein
VSNTPQFALYAKRTSPVLVEASPFDKFARRADLSLSDLLVPSLRLSDCADQSRERFGLTMGAGRQDQPNPITGLAK